MDLQLWKKRKKELNLSFEELAEITQISIRQLYYIFGGKAKNPGFETVDRIEKALGIEKTPSDEELSEGERELMEMVSQLTDEEIREIAQFIEFLVSKRKN